MKLEDLLVRNIGGRRSHTQFDGFDIFRIECKACNFFVDQRILNSEYKKDLIMLLAENNTTNCPTCETPLKIVFNHKFIDLQTNDTDILALYLKNNVYVKVIQEKIEGPLTSVSLNVVLKEYINQTNPNFYETYKIIIAGLEEI